MTIPSLTKLNLSLRNIGINLRAPGPVAVLIVFAVCITVLGLWGEGKIANQAVTALYVLIVLTVVALARKV